MAASFKSSQFDEALLIIEKLGQGVPPDQLALFADILVEHLGRDIVPTAWIMGPDEGESGLRELGHDRRGSVDELENALFPDQTADETDDHVVVGTSTELPPGVPPLFGSDR